MDTADDDGGDDEPQRKRQRRRELEQLLYVLLHISVLILFTVLETTQDDNGVQGDKDIFPKIYQLHIK